MERYAAIDMAYNDVLFHNCMFLGCFSFSIFFDISPNFLQVADFFQDEIRCTFPFIWFNWCISGKSKY